MIFCNTIASCRCVTSSICTTDDDGDDGDGDGRAVAYALDDTMQLQAVSYHGGLDSGVRAANLAVFRDTDHYQVISSNLTCHMSLLCF
jgi:hypothetical protein